MAQVAKTNKRRPEGSAVEDCTSSFPEDNLWCMRITDQMKSYCTENEIEQMFICVVCCFFVQERDSLGCLFVVQDRRRANYSSISCVRVGKTAAGRPELCKCHIMLV